MGCKKSLSLKLACLLQKLKYGKSYAAVLSENEFFGSIHTQLERALAKHPELVTPEGVRFKVPQPMENPGVLQNAANKATASTGIKREKILPRVQSYEQARNKALEVIGEVDVHSGEPFLGKLHDLKDKVVGRSWHDGDVIIRLDFDPAKGPHINVTDFRLGKGTSGVSVAIPFEGDYNTIQSILKHLNTDASLEQVKSSFEASGNFRGLYKIQRAMESKK